MYLLCPCDRCMPMLGHRQGSELENKWFVAGFAFGLGGVRVVPFAKARRSRISSTILLLSSLSSLNSLWVSHCLLHLCLA